MKNDNCVTFIYLPDKYPGPIAMDAKPSKKCDEYHKNSCIQINHEGKNILKKANKK